jgi:hypothetical protein
MIGQWNNEGLMLYTEASNLYTAAEGVPVYLIGASAAWNAARPVNILSAFVRVTDYDTPLRVLTAAEYSAISSKSETGIPSALYYLPSMATGMVYLWPVPDATYSIGVRTRAALSAALALETVLSLPPGYEQALIYNLAVEVSPEYGKDPDEVAVQAAAAKKNIKRTNFRPACLAGDPAFVAASRPNILTGE